VLLLNVMNDCLPTHVLDLVTLLGTHGALYVTLPHLARQGSSHGASSDVPGRHASALAGRSSPKRVWEWRRHFDRFDANGTTACLVM
jgi:hypothetical protein